MDKAKVRALLELHIEVLRQEMLRSVESYLDIPFPDYVSTIQTDEMWKVDFGHYIIDTNEVIRKYL